MIRRPIIKDGCWWHESGLVVGVEVKVCFLHLYSFLQLKKKWYASSTVPHEHLSVEQRYLVHTDRD